MLYLRSEAHVRTERSLRCVGVLVPSASFHLDRWHVALHCLVIHPLVTNIILLVRVLDFLRAFRPLKAEKLADLRERRTGVRLDNLQLNYAEKGW